MTPALGNASASANAETSAAPYSAGRTFASGLRLVSLIVFAVSMVLSGCGRQVTGLTSAVSNQTVPAGFMSLRFRVNGPLDFTNFEYVIVFNTSGSGVEPYANQFTSGFQNYSYAWIVGGTGGSAQTQLIQYYINVASSTISTQPVVVPQQLVQLTVGTSGTPNEFTLQFARSLFNQPNPTSTASPNPGPTTATQTAWNVNFFTANGNPANGTVGTPIDANGTQGIADTSYSLSVDTTQVVNGPAYVKPAGSATVQNPSAAINQDQVNNNP